MNRQRWGRVGARPYVATLLALGLALAAVATATATPREPVSIRLLSVSDWHAQLDPLSVFGEGEFGGAAELSTYFQQERADNPNTLTLTAGDAFGGSPPLSGFFDEEPAVRAMNLMGFDADTFGNHNFDRGVEHLQQMIDLAEFPYVSANLANVDDNLTDVAPYVIYDLDGVEVAIIGITNPEAPTLVFPGSFGTIEVTEPTKAAKKARIAAKKEGADVFVVIAHMGITGEDADGNPTGPLIDFAEGVGGFDVIFGDHTDREFSAVINNALVVENRSRGRTYARVDLDVDPRNGRVVSREVEFVDPVSAAVEPDPAVVEMLAPFRVALAEALDGEIGETTAVFQRGGGVERLGEVPIGNLVADSMRLRYGTQLGFTNGGGIRSSLPSSYLPADTSLRRPAAGYAAGPPFDLVVGDALTVLPFGNVVVTRTVTGAQLYEVLEHSVAAIPSASGRFGQISGFRFTFDSSQPAGSRVVSVELDDGTPILPDATTYTLATNDFVNAGGDGYTMLADGQGVSREVMADVLRLHIEELGTLTPTTEGRITDIAAP